MTLPKELDIGKIMVAARVKVCISKSKLAKGLGIKRGQSIRYQRCEKDIPVDIIFDMMCAAMSFYKQKRTE